MEPFLVNERIPALVPIVAGSLDKVFSIENGPSLPPSASGT